MAYPLLEQQLPGVMESGLLTDKPVAFGSTLAVTGATTLTGALAANGGITGTNAIALTRGSVYPIVAPSATPVAYTGDATLVAGDLNKNVTNTGAAGTITLTLPAVSGLTGYTLHVEVTAAQIVRVDPAGTESIFLGGSGVAGKYLNIAGVIGNCADIYCDGTQWLVVNRDGVLTKEA